MLCVRLREFPYSLNIDEVVEAAYLILAEALRSTAVEATELPWLLLSWLLPLCQSLASRPFASLKWDGSMLTLGIRG